MKKVFSLSYKNDSNISPVEIFEKNLHDLEILCKKANDEDFQVILHSPDIIEEPKNVYEISVMIAEDMVLKYNPQNKILRKLDDC